MRTLDATEESSGIDAFPGDPRWAAITEIVGSPAFSKAPRLSQLLLYLAAQTLSGRASLMTEFEIATVVFGRGVDFDPAADAFVRSYMLRLRQRLAQVDFSGREFLVGLPRGQYAITFDKAAEPEPMPETPPAPAVLPMEATPPAPAKAAPQRLLYILLVAVLLVTGSDLAVHLLSRPPASAASPLWNQLFTSDRPTTFIAADSSLVLLHHYMHHEPTLAEYTSGRFREEALDLYRSGVEPSGLFERRYTSIADLELTRLLGEIAGEKHTSLRTTFARDMTLDDMKRSNIILSGSKGANPWLEMFEPQLNFLIEENGEGHTTVVHNRHPRAGEAAEYLPNVPPAPESYAVLAFISGIEPSSNALIIEGTSVAGTEAIADLLSDGQELNHLLQQFKEPDGSLMHFELLLSSQHLNGSAVNFHVVASRTYS
jgi:hypothetical protein